MDRFHFKSHSYCVVFDPDAYPSMDADKTTTSESLNARIEKTVPYIRYVSSDTLIPFLKIRIASMNVVTGYRRRYEVYDVDDADVWGFFKKNIPCSCESCSTVAVIRIEERESEVKELENAVRQEEQKEEAQVNKIISNNDEVVAQNAITVAIPEQSCNHGCSSDSDNEVQYVEIDGVHNDSQPSVDQVAENKTQ